jgi:hypothetical protein
MKKREGGEFPIMFCKVVDTPKGAPHWAWACDCDECQEQELEGRLHGPFMTQDEARRDVEQHIALLFCEPGGRMS